MKCKVIAITGQIGSGKSAVGKYLQQQGYSVLDCDQISRLVADMPCVQQSVAALLGEQSVVDGKLNRPLIRKTIFADDSLYSRYNQIFFDQIKQEITTAVCRLSAQGCRVVFVEIPLIDAFYYPWDAIWMVQCEVATRISRVTQRDGVDKSDVLAVSSKQSYQTAPTHTLINDGTLHDLYAKVDDLVKQIL